MKVKDCKDSFKNNMFTRWTCIDLAILEIGCLQFGGRLYLAEKYTHCAVDAFQYVYIVTRCCIYGAIKCTRKQDEYCENANNFLNNDIMQNLKREFLDVLENILQTIDFVI
jgi:hypothetical protein